MQDRRALFYPGEIVTGYVEVLTDYLATIKLTGDYRLPLERRFITWQPIERASDVLSVGERIQAMVRPKSTRQSAYNCRTLEAKLSWKGFWLDRLPLLDDPLVEFQTRFPVGSIVDLQFVSYLNHYVAYAKTAEGLIVELMVRDLHPRDDESSFSVTLLPEQFIKIAIRRFDRRTIRSKRLI